jgi:hypothetical protein
MKLVQGIYIVGFLTPQDIILDTGLNTPRLTYMWLEILDFQYFLEDISILLIRE